MAFNFDELTRKAKDVANKAADRTKDAAELVKLNVAIAGEQKEIDKNYRAIGEWFVSEYEGEIPDAVREAVEAVNASKAKIAELEASKPVKEEPAPEVVELAREKDLAVMTTTHRMFTACGLLFQSGLNGGVHIQ